MKRGTDCTSTDGLVALAYCRADPDTNRSAGLHSCPWYSPQGCHERRIELARCRSDLFTASLNSRLARKSITRNSPLSKRRPMPASNWLQALPPSASHSGGLRQRVCLARTPPTGCARSCWPGPLRPFASPTSLSRHAPIWRSGPLACAQSAPPIWHPGSARCAGTCLRAW